MPCSDHQHTSPNGSRAMFHHCHYSDMRGKCSIWSKWLQLTSAQQYRKNQIVGLCHSSPPNPGISLAWRGSPPCPDQIFPLVRSILMSPGERQEFGLLGSVLQISVTFSIMSVCQCSSQKEMQMSGRQYPVHSIRLESIRRGKRGYLRSNGAYLSQYGWMATWLIEYALWGIPQALCFGSSTPPWSLVFTYVSQSRGGLAVHTPIDQWHRLEYCPLLCRRKPISLDWLAKREYQLGCWYRMGRWCIGYLLGLFPGHGVVVGHCWMLRDHGGISLGWSKQSPRAVWRRLRWRRVPSL